MYNDADLGTLMDALNSLTSNGFLQYDINVGQVSPYLSIVVSETQVSAFPVLARFPQGAALVNLYYTTDFTPPVATFISNFQTGMASKVNANQTIMSAISAQMANWTTFASTYNALG